MIKGQTVFFKTAYQHGYGVIVEFDNHTLGVRTTRVYSNFDGTPMVNGYIKTIYISQAYIQADVAAQ